VLLGGQKILTTSLPLTDTYCREPWPCGPGRWLIWPHDAAYTSVAVHGAFPFQGPCSGSWGPVTADLGRGRLSDPPASFPLQVSDQPFRHSVCIRHSVCKPVTLQVSYQTVAFEDGHVHTNVRILILGVHEVP
jgi:hypothetical protein